MSTTRRPAVNWAALFAVGIATILTYLAWLGWHRSKTLGSDGYLHGPYEPWQVIGLAVSIVVIAAVGAWLLRSADVAGTISIALTAVFSVEAANSSDDDGLWLIGAVLLLVVSRVGVGLVAYLVSLLRQRAVTPA